MKAYPIDKIRNVAVISHGGAGKTSLAEAMLYDAGVTNRLGKVNEGTSIMDYTDEEVKRQISINTTLAPIEWSEHKLNIIDTPGYFDFVGEVKTGLRPADAALVLVCGVSGVEVGTEMVWGYANDYGLPRVVFVNKLDRENADYYKVVDALRETFGLHLAPVALPIGKEENFKGIVDLIRNKAYYFEDGGRKVVEGDIPNELSDRVAEYREKVIESVAETDDELLMKYLEGEGLTDDEIINGVREGTMSGKLVPILCGSATKNIGVQPLLNTIIDLLPSPKDTGSVSAKAGEEEVTIEPDEKAPFSALVFKTTADPYVGRLSAFRVYSGTLTSDSQIYNPNKDKTERIGQLFALAGKEQKPVDKVQAGDIAAVAKLSDTETGDTLCDKSRPVTFSRIQFPKPVISMAIEAKSKGDEDKIGVGLSRLEEEDPTFTIERNNETKETILSGMGDLHIEVISSRLKEKFGVEVELKVPRIPYRETIKKKVRVEGKHKKQSGGKGQYGHVFLELEPMAPGEGFEFVDKIFGGSVPQQYRPAVEKGVRETMEEGILAGYPVVDVRTILYDGSYHSVDSSEMAFKIAASMAFKKGFMDANPVLLEPVVKVEVTVPDEYMGDIIGDLNKKRGKILGMEPRGKLQIVKAMAPLGEMARYATDLRSMTQGRGMFTIEIDHYEEVPAHLADKIIAEAKKEE